MADPVDDAGEGPDPSRRRSLRVRWPFLLAAPAALVLAIGAFVWFVRVPGFRPALQPGERFGVDVSGHQGAIDWPSVARDDRPDATD